jgi:hypothetical protein
MNADWQYTYLCQSGEKYDPQQNGEFLYFHRWRIFSRRIPLLRLLANFFSQVLEIFWLINFAVKLS